MLYCREEVAIHGIEVMPRAGMQIGPVKVGSEHRIALQTMTTTDTRDVEGTVDQVHSPATHGSIANSTSHDVHVQHLRKSVRSNASGLHTHCWPSM